MYNCNPTVYFVYTYECIENICRKKVMEIKSCYIQLISLRVSRLLFPPFCIINTDQCDSGKRNTHTQKKDEDDNDE